MTSEIKMKWNKDENVLEIENVIKEKLTPEIIKYHLDEALKRQEKLEKELKEVERIMELKSVYEKYIDKPSSEFLRRIKTKDFFDWLKVPDQLKSMNREGLNAMVENYRKDINDAKEKAERLIPFKDKIIEEKTSKMIG